MTELASWLDLPAALWHHLAWSAARWTSLLAAALVASGLLRGSSRGRRNLWLLTLLALPALPLLDQLAPAWSLPDWRAAAGLEIGAPESVAVAPLPAAAGDIATVPGREAPAAAGPALPAAIWLVGLLLLSVREATDRVGSWALRRASPAAPSRLRAEAGEAASRLATPPVEVHLADLSVPALSGLLRPTILLPPASVGWPADRRRAALLHELAHRRHGDPWLDAISRWITIVFWFHPGAWWARRRLRDEMERMADAAASSHGLGAETYGRALIDIARGARHPLHGLTMARPGGLETRLRALVAGHRRISFGRRCVVGALLALGALASAATATSDLEPWLAVTDTGWSLRCGDHASCLGIQRQAERLLGEAGTSGVVVVQDVRSSELMAYAAQGPAPVPVVPPASVAKLTLAALWWEAGLGSSAIPCPELWTGAEGMEVRAVRDRGDLEVPREMLIHSCTTAAAAMAEILVERQGAAKVAKDLAAFGFADRAGTPWLPEWLPSPRLEAGASWEASRPEMAAMLGRVSTTPLHIVSFLQAIGDEGVRRPMSLPGQSAEQGERVMEATTAALLRAAMGEAVSDGTGRRAARQLADSSWRLLGKTGTRRRDDGAFDGWFGGLATDAAGTPRFALVVFLDGGGMGSGAPAVMAAEMTRFLAEGDPPPG